MKKMKLVALVMAAVMGLTVAGCGSATTTETTAQQAETTAEQTEATEAQTEAETQKTKEADLVRVGSLKGPTTMGMVQMMDASEKGETEGNYSFTMVAQADELLAKMVSKDLDLALIPANVASVLYNKTEQGISVIDINTLGVLYAVTADDSIQSVKDLAGKTVYMTGKGTTPEYALNYLLQANGVTDCSIEFKSEATEVAAVLAEDSSRIGILPQPFVTAAMAQNPDLKMAFDLTKEWKAVSTDSQLLTGVTVVRNEFLQQNPEAVKTFIKEHKASTDYINANVEAGAELVAKYGIIEKAPVAAKAIPYCNITCMTGEEMKTALSGYLNVLFEQDPKSVGGTLPQDNFYFAE